MALLATDAGRALISGGLERPRYTIRVVLDGEHGRFRHGDAGAIQARRIAFAGTACIPKRDRDIVILVVAKYLKRASVIAAQVEALEDQVHLTGGLHHYVAVNIFIFPGRERYGCASSNIDVVALTRYLLPAAIGVFDGDGLVALHRDGGSLILRCERRIGGRRGRRCRFACGSGCAGG